MTISIISCSNLNNRPKIIKKDQKCATLPLKIEWKAPQNKADKNEIVREVKGYKVFIKKSSDKHFEEFITVKDKTELVFKDSKLFPNTAYDIRVVAYNDAGDGEPSKIIHVKTCETKRKKK